MHDILSSLAFAGLRQGTGSVKEAHIVEAVGGWWRWRSRDG
jgi:hypothetical protein